MGNSNRGRQIETGLYNGDYFQKDIICKVCNDINLYYDTTKNMHIFNLVDIDKNNQIIIYLDEGNYKFNSKTDNELLEFVAKYMKNKIKGAGYKWDRKNEELTSSIEYRKVCDIYYVYDCLMKRGTDGKAYGSEGKGVRKAENEMGQEAKKEEIKNNQTIQINKISNNDDDKKYIESVLIEHSDSVKQELQQLVKQGGIVRKIEVGLSDIYAAYKEDLMATEKALQEKYPNLGDINVLAIDKKTMTAKYEMRELGFNADKNIEEKTAKNTKTKKEKEEKETSNTKELKEENKMACWKLEQYKEGSETFTKMVRFSQEEIAKEFCKGDKKKALIIWGKLRKLLEKPYRCYQGIYRVYSEPKKNLNLIVSNGITEPEATRLFNSEVGIKFTSYMQQNNKKMGDGLSYLGIEAHDDSWAIIINAEKELPLKNVNKLEDDLLKVFDKIIEKEFGKNTGIKINKLRNYNDDEFCGQYVFNFASNIREKQ